MFPDRPQQELPLSQWVFNTKAHPLPIWGSPPEALALARLGITPHAYDPWREGGPGGLIGHGDAGHHGGSQVGDVGVDGTGSSATALLLILHLHHPVEMDQNSHIYMVANWIMTIRAKGSFLELF